MNLLDIDKIMSMVIEQKQRGVSIRKSLKAMGISRTTFYRWVNEHGTTKWEDLEPESKVYVRHIKPSQDFYIKQQEDKVYTQHVDSETDLYTRQKDRPEFWVKKTAKN